MMKKEEIESFNGNLGAKVVEVKDMIDLADVIDDDFETLAVKKTNVENGMILCPHCRKQIGTIEELSGKGRYYLYLLGVCPYCYDVYKFIMRDFENIGKITFESWENEEFLIAIIIENVDQKWATSSDGHVLCEDQSTSVFEIRCAYAECWAHLGFACERISLEFDEHFSGKIAIATLCPKCGMGNVIKVL